MHSYIRENTEISRVEGRESRLSKLRNFDDLGGDSTTPDDGSDRSPVKGRDEREMKRNGEERGKMSEIQRR